MVVTMDVVKAYKNAPALKCLIFSDGTKAIQFPSFNMMKHATAVIMTGNLRGEKECDIRGYGAMPVVD